MTPPDLPDLSDFFRRQELYPGEMKPNQGMQCLVGFEINDLLRVIPMIAFQKWDVTLPGSGLVARGEAPAPNLNRAKPEHYGAGSHRRKRLKTIRERAAI